jgi:hypothetical protein
MTVPCGCEPDLRNASVAENLCTQLTSDMTCGNHRVGLVDTAILDCFGIPTCLGASHRYALLMRMGSYWERVQKALPITMREASRDCSFASKPAPSAFNLEVVDYLLSVFVPPSKNKNDPESDICSPKVRMWQSTSSGLEYHAKLMRLLELFPRDWFEGLFFYSEDELVEGTDILGDLLYSSVVTVPSAGKWF